jgi:hypothetical protein
MPHVTIASASASHRSVGSLEQIRSARAGDSVRRTPALQPRRFMIALSAVSCKRLLGHHVLALHKAARVLTRRHVREQDIVLQRAKEWNPRSNQHGDARDD